MNKKNDDLIMGQLNEDYIKDVLCSHFGLKTLMKLDLFHPMDFHSPNKYFEIKSRRFNHNKYNTTMVGKNKLDWIKENYLEGIEYYFVFVFEDGDYYYKYNPDDEFKTSIGGRVDRGLNEIKLYYYIPIDKLIKF